MKYLGHTLVGIFAIIGLIVVVFGIMAFHPTYHPGTNPAVAH